jgi:prefoldin subunit 5
MEDWRKYQKERHLAIGNKIYVINSWTGEAIEVSKKEFEEYDKIEKDGERLAFFAERTDRKTIKLDGFLLS